MAEAAKHPEKLERLTVRKDVTRRAYNALWESIVEARTLVLHNVADAYEDVANRISAYAEALGRQVERMSAEDAVNEAAEEMDDAWGVAIRHMRRDVDDIYRTIQEATRDHREEDGGTARQAVQEALDAFAERGITEFRDKAGRRWGLPEYADMFVRTNIQRAGLRATIETMDRYGWDRCFVNSHMGCCEACEDWQGVVLSIRGMTPDIPTLQEAMDAGLFHPNCAHQLQVYLPGLSEPGQGVPEGYTREANDDLYARRQKQRYIERKIREWKKKQAAATTPERERECFERVKLWQKRARENAGGANVRRYDREGGRVRLKLKPNQLHSNSPHDPQFLTDGVRDDTIVPLGDNTDKSPIQPFGSPTDKNPLIPNAITASTSQNKVQRYLLNNKHPVGKHKAKLLNSVLGVTIQSRGNI